MKPAVWAGGLGRAPGTQSIAVLLEDMREDDEIFACSREKKATETIAPFFCLCFFKAFEKRVEHHTHTPHAPKQP